MKFITTVVAISLAFLSPHVTAECCVEDSDTLTKLDLFPSTVVTNELHLDGGELRYTNVGVFEDETLDLVVTVTSGNYTDIVESWISKDKPVPFKTGKHGQFGAINHQPMRNKPKAGEGNFRFCLVEEGTHNEVTLGNFSWTVYDADMRGSDESGIGDNIQEKMIMDVSQASSFSLYPNIEESEIKLSCEDLNDVYPCSYSRTVFHSSTKHEKGDNPHDPNHLTEKQLMRSIAFYFENTSCWEFSYDIYCPADQAEYTGPATECRVYHGGNFFFAGESESLINESVCYPVPHPTDAPTSFPDPTPPAPECPEDISLIKTVGVTPIDLNDAVHIVSQDTSTVTVGLKNSWVDGDDSIDSIYYQYKIDDFTERCYSNTTVPTGEVFNEITIDCMHTKAFAELKICVVDDALDEGDNAEVPRCCHADQDDKDVVCYTLTVNCVSACFEEEQRAMRALRGSWKS